jgi:hypothetical protein
MHEHCLHGGFLGIARAGVWRVNLTHFHDELQFCFDPARKNTLLFVMHVRILHLKTLERCKCRLGVGFVVAKLGRCPLCPAVGTSTLQLRASRRCLPLCRISDRELLFLSVADGHQISEQELYGHQDPSFHVSLFCPCFVSSLVI